MKGRTLHNVTYTNIQPGVAPACGGCGSPKFLLAPRRHRHFHASSALHKNPGPFILLFLGGNTIGIVCKNSWTPLTFGTLTALASQQFFLALSLYRGKHVHLYIIQTCLHTTVITGGARGTKCTHAPSNQLEWLNTCLFNTKATFFPGSHFSWKRLLIFLSFKNTWEFQYFCPPRFSTLMCI